MTSLKEQIEYIQSLNMELVYKYQNINDLNTFIKSKLDSNNILLERNNVKNTNIKRSIIELEAMKYALYAYNNKIDINKMINKIDKEVIKLKKKNNTNPLGLDKMSVNNLG